MVKNSVVLPGALVGNDVIIDCQVVDKHAKIIHAKEIIADPANPGYIRREDTL